MTVAGVRLAATKKVAETAGSEAASAASAAMGEKSADVRVSWAAKPARTRPNTGAVPADGMESRLSASFSRPIVSPRVQKFNCTFSVTLFLF